MVYRKRLGIWIIFVVACLILQMIVPLIPSMAINVKQAILDRELKVIVQELQKIDEEKVENKPTVGNGDEDYDSTSADQENDKSAISMMLDIILTTGKYIGILIIVTGIMQMVMGFMHEDAEAMHKAVSLMVVGAVLIGAEILAPQIIGTPGAG